MKSYNIPIVLFIFKRAEKSAIIIDQIAKIQPQKIYLIADGPRNKEEESQVQECRKTVEQHITWQCEVIKNYAEKNRGVYYNIADGAKWVFKQEEFAIFLEDDNFPALSFFKYCEELLHRYIDDTRILWICGTNYMGEYIPQDGSDYLFTKLMLPCGWASWSDKFIKFYDGEMKLFRDRIIRDKIKYEYHNKSLYHQDAFFWNQIIYEVDNNEKIFSWDYQMAFCIRANNLYGIAPKYNQIKNIGADIDSTHGGTTMKKEMTNRFCEVPIKDLSFPLKHPKAVMLDYKFERKMEHIIVYPIKDRIRISVINFIKKVLGINSHDSLKKQLQKYLKKH